MRRWLWRLAIAVLILAAAVAVKYAFFRTEPVPVTVFKVARGLVEETVTNSKAGTIRTRHRASLSPETGGRVAELNVRKGDSVKAGSVLMRLDASQQRAQAEDTRRALDVANEGVKESCLAMGLAERELVRAEGLAREKILAEDLLDQARNRRDVSRAACEGARARVRQLDSQVDMAEAELAKTVLRAPFDGVVAELRVERGEWVTPSPPGVPIPPVLDLLDPGAIYVSAPLDEVDRGKISVGQPARITMDAFPGKSFLGHVTRIAPYILDVAEQSRTFEVEATFDDLAFARSLPPGASADIEVILSASKDVIRVPTYAVLEGRRVLLLQEGCPSDATWAGKARLLLSGGGGECLTARDVELGLKNWEFAEVKRGLGVGDRVVVSLDRAEVKEGARARQAAVTEK